MRLTALLDFLFPPTCLLCERRHEGESFLCQECLVSLKGSMNPAVLTGSDDFKHIQGDIYFDRVLVVWDYFAEIEDLIHHMKYQRGMKLARLLGRLMGEAVNSLLVLNADAVLLPVPLHKTRRRERGYNQSELLSDGFREIVQMDYQKNILARKKNTSTQTKLDAEARQRNVHEAFRVNRLPAVQGRTVLVLDDVSTTGATLNSCARCLKEAGAKNVIGLTLARPTLN